MATDAVVLKSFLLKLGFSLDEAQFKRFQESITTVSKSAIELTKSFVGIGTAVTGTAVAAAVGLNKIAKPLESLYFAAQRTGASANELRTLTGAFEQIGVSADEAAGSIESFAAARRTMPGIDQLFGIDPRQKNNAQAFIQRVSRLANLDVNPLTHSIAAQQAAMVGISENTLLQFENNRGAFIKALQEREKIVGKFDVGKMAKTSHEFNDAFRDTRENVDLTADKIATGVMPAAQKVLGYTNNIADLYNRINDETGGWLGHLTAAAGVSSSILATYKAIAALRGVMGGAALAEGAGAAGAAAGSGMAATIGGIATIAVPIVLAAVASYELYKHKDAVEAVGKSIVSKLPSFAGGTTFDSADVANWMRGITGRITDSLLAMTASFEGHARNGFGVYKDEGGRDTAGYGHLVRPGEDLRNLDQAGAVALLKRDLLTAGQAVQRLVHVALTSNQMKALTDFAFNVGYENFEKSTLLKELNQGHYNAAADRLKDWNKIFKDGHYIVSQGLANRRAAEEQLFRTPDKPNVTLTQKTDIHIEAGPHAQDTADRIAKAQSRVNGDVVRNLAGATS